MHTRRTALAALLALLLQPPPVAPAAEGASLTVFAAADLAFAFRDLVPRFEAAHGAKVTTVLGSTGHLAKQVEEGAPADVIFAANVAFVDALREKGAVLADTQTLYARGRIVLASRRSTGPRLSGLADLLRAEVRRVAIANPDHAPYGRAAREALEAAGLWERVRPKLVYGENIRHALQFLESGAVEAAIVALSIAGAPDVEHVPIDAALHRPLDQAAAVTARSPRPELGRAFLAFVTGSEGRAVMERYGFVVPRAGGGS
jgi:molybdate transport system substrate-binding protein